MYENIRKNMKSIIFLINAFFILITEGLIYGFFQDYSLFIDRLSMRLASINILYVKIFQAFALNNRLIDDKTNNKLIKFTDNAPWNYSDIELYKLIEMADKYNIRLPDGYEIPINSGMISLVFTGREKGNPGKQVIIKMKRKNIQKRLDDAIDNLLFSMYILSFIPIINKYQLAEVVNKNIEIIRHQTNFLEEIDNMDRIRENCKNLKYAKIPKANRQVTEEYPDIILMDRIEGIKINEVKEEDYEPFAKLVVKFGLVTTVVHGVAHGDLHAGNILFIKDKHDTEYPHKIGIIDFGIIYEVGTEFKELMFECFTQMFDISPREGAEKILNSCIIEPPGIFKTIPVEDYNNIIAFTEKILDDTVYKSKEANQIQLYKFISKFKEYLSKDKLSNLGIRPSDDFVKSQLVLAMSHGVTLTLCKDDFITLMDKVINELFHTKMLLE
jgi:predicted unusual protein kinase regulating ubiquinone biosynthesis (AarF/ABC1/UbiB family)